MRPRLALGSALVLTACAGCDLAVLNPPTGEFGSLRFQVTEQEDTSVVRVLGLVDRARLQLSGSGIELDTVVPARVEGGRVVVRLVVSPPPAGPVAVRAELRAGVRALLEGNGTLGRDGGDHILLRPLPDRLLAAPLPAEIDALRDTLALSALVLFATGDVWRGARPTWESENPGVLDVRPGNIAISRSNGWATLRLSFEHLTRKVVVRVAQRPTELWGVAPADTTIEVGDSFPMRVFGEDRNGSALVPGALVTWFAGGGVVLDSLGVVTATQAGPAFARAVLGSTQHTSVITVTTAAGGS